MDWTDESVAKFANAYRSFMDEACEFRRDTNSKKSLIGKELALESILSKLGAYIASANPEVIRHQGLSEYVEVIKIDCRYIYGQLREAGMSLGWSQVKRPSNLAEILPEAVQDAH